jgi:predicted peptidase
MSGNSEGSTNAVDRLLGHANGPETAPSEDDATRLQYSKQIAVVNFTRLSNWCDDIATDGLIYFDKKRGH